MRFFGVCGANQSEIRINFGANLRKIHANLNKIYGKIHANRPANQVRIQIFTKEKLWT